MRVLFVNPVEAACGVHQFGLNLWRILAGGTPALPGGFSYRYCAPKSEDELLKAVRENVDLVFYNFYPCTMPWVTLQTLNAVRFMGLKQVTIFHEVKVTGFDAYVYPDPTFKDCSRGLNDWFWMGRPLPERRHSGHVRVDRAVPIIGSSGFGFGNKGFKRLVELVLAEFERARIRLHLPYARHGDADGEGSRAVADECRQMVAGVPGIELEVDHEFLPAAEYMDWLAANDINAFLYNEMPGRGVASTIDHALAVYRPIAITRTTMFRHLHGCEPSICIEDHSLTEIMAQGLTPLEPIYRQFADHAVLERVEAVLGQVAKPACVWAGWNRLLRNADRVHYAPKIDEMRQVVPEMMGRKIAEANVQQAWCLDLVRRATAGNTPTLHPKGERENAVGSVLCVGCFEDTAFSTLQRENPGVIGIDPALPPHPGPLPQGGEGEPSGGKYDLHSFRINYPKARYDCVFACSVLEHVADDEEFITDMCEVLKPDGVGILTCDFKADYRHGDPLPATDVRLYTAADIERLSMVLQWRGCYLLDKPDLRGEPDFTYQGHDYSFLGLVFKKL